MVQLSAHRWFNRPAPILQIHPHIWYLNNLFWFKLHSRSWYSFMCLIKPLEWQPVYFVQYWPGIHFWSRNKGIFYIQLHSVYISGLYVWSIRMAFDRKTWQQVFNMFKEISKVGDLSQGWPEDSLFNSYYTELSGRTLLLSLDCSHCTLDPYLIMLSAKQGSIKYHFLSLYFFIYHSYQWSTEETFH